MQYEGKVLTPTGQDYDDKMETMKLTFDQELKAGSDAVLAIEYVGIHNDKMAGFYRSAYEDHQTKEKKHMVVTQFEPTDARKAFPCWDEPALKAVFDVTLIVPETMTGLSNMPDVTTEKLAGGLKKIKFAPTPIMSTYLVAFAVSELDYIEAFTTDAAKTKVRVYAPKGLASQGQFALDVAVKTLEFFAVYFDIPYPLPKMDLLCVAHFSAGAMENYGLVTFRTVYLLHDEKASAAKSKQSIAYIVGHELAHQWFGNLVSPGWWSDLWLNEGFATWAGWLATDHLFPEWSVWTQFVNDDMQRGLGLDSLRSSHPIEVPVQNPAEIHQIFDAISYSKGASVIRMLANYLGADTFRDGVRDYLKKFKYGNADTMDLWDYLSKASGNKPIAKLMNSWTRQIGFPVVTVTSQKVGDETVLNVRQERFLSSGDLKHDEDSSIWFTPLQIVTSSKLKEPSSDVLSEKEAVVKIKDLDLAKLADDQFYKLNLNQSGFYRTKYEPALLKKLGQAVRDGKFGSSDRIGILTDTYALSKAGYSSVVELLDLLANYEKEHDYIVWSEIALELASIRSIWWEAKPETVDRLKSFSKEMFSPVAQRLGWEYKKGEGFLTALLRTLAISNAGKSGDATVIAEAQKRFKEFMNGTTEAIHPDLRGAVFSIVLQNGGVVEYEQVLKLFRETRTADQKLIALSALGSAKTEELLLRTLKFAQTEEVPANDIIYVFGSVSANPVGKKLAWPFVKENWKTLHDRYYTGSMSLLSRVVSSTTESFSSQKWYDDFKQFFADKNLPNISRAIQQTLEKIDANSKWYARDAKAVDQWLENKKRK